MSRPPDRRHLVFEDTFDAVNPVWSTRESAYTEGSTRAKADQSCAQVRRGSMVLSVREDPEHPGNLLTGHVGTQGAAEFTYGYFETRAKFQALRGFLSAFWLQTTEDYIPGQAEVDIAECTGRPSIWHNVYWRTADMGAGEFRSAKVVSRLPDAGDQADWHTYALDWRPQGYWFYVDGVEVATIKVGLSDRPKFLVLSLRLPDYMLRLIDPDRLSDYKARFAYVRAWQ